MVKIRKLSSWKKTAGNPPKGTTTKKKPTSQKQGGMDKKMSSVNPDFNYILPAQEQKQEKGFVPTEDMEKLDPPIRGNKGKEKQKNRWVQGGSNSSGNSKGLSSITTRGGKEKI